MLPSGFEKIVNLLSFYRWEIVHEVIYRMSCIQTVGKGFHRNTGASEYWYAAEYSGVGDYLWRFH